MTATTVIADRPAEVRTRQTPSETTFQEKTEASENTLKNSVVRFSAFLRPHRSAMRLAMMDPMNMPTNDSDVTYATWLTVMPQSLIRRGAVIEKLLMSANSKK